MEPTLRQAAPHSGRTSGQAAGFTVIELVVVIVLIGILVAVAAPRFFATQDFRNDGFADELAAAIRYAQKVAVASQCPVEVTINGTPSGDSDSYTYALRFQSATASGTPSCAGASYLYPLPRTGGGVWQLQDPRITLTDSGQIVFDASGASSNGARLDIEVGNREVRVEAGTGLTYVQ